MGDRIAHLTACQPGTVTPLWTSVRWWPPDPAIGNPWFPVPGQVWLDPDDRGSDGSCWPPHTPGTCREDDIEKDRPR